MPASPVMFGALTSPFHPTSAICSTRSCSGRPSTLSARARSSTRKPRWRWQTCSSAPSASSLRAWRLPGSQEMAGLPAGFPAGWTAAHAHRAAGIPIDRPAYCCAARPPRAGRRPARRGWGCGVHRRRARRSDRIGLLASSLKLSRSATGSEPTARPQKNLRYSTRSHSVTCSWKRAHSSRL